MKVNKKSTVLDLASGSGDLARLVKKKSKCKCIVYDANKKMLEKAKKKIEDGIFITGKAENLPFKNNTFDYVLVGFGLRNFYDLNKALIETKRVLKKGGHFTWVDLRGKDMVRDTESAFEGVDLKCIHEQTITSEVIHALDGIHERKMQMIKLHVPKFLQSAFKDFAGVKKSKIYNAFNDGSAVYLAKAFQKS